MADHLEHSERWRTHQQPRRVVDYHRPGFVRPADPEDICHCGEPVAIVSVPEMADLGPAVRALCVYCLPIRCDVEPNRSCGGGPDAA